MEEEYLQEYFEFDGNEIEEKRKYLVVVIYDISDNKKRREMAKFLKGYGFRVQRSVFECILDKYKYKKLVKNVHKYIGEEDLLRVYKLAGNTDVHVWGSVEKVSDEEIIII